MIVDWYGNLVTVEEGMSIPDMYYRDYQRKLMDHETLTTTKLVVNKSISQEFSNNGIAGLKAIEPLTLK